MRRCFLLLGLCGCDALFGLDSLDYAPDARVDAGPDAPRVAIAGVVQQHWLRNNPLNQPVLVDNGMITAPVSVRLSDGSTPPFTLDPVTGVLAFEASLGERYSIIHETETNLLEYQLTSQSFTIEEDRLGRPNQQAPGPNAAVTWTPPQNGLLASDLRIISTGIWTSTAPMSPVANTFTLNWGGAARFPGQQSALLSGGENDALYFLHFIAVPATATEPAYNVVDQYAPVPNATLNANSATPFTTSLITLPRASCVDLHWRRSAEYTRLQQYPAFGSPAGTMQLLAIAKPQVGFRALFELASLTTTTDDSVSIDYTNPLPGYDTVIFENTIVTRTITGGVTISANMEYLDLFTPAGPCVLHDTPPPASLPLGLTLAGVPLEDDVVIGVDTSKPLELTWTWDGAPAPVTQVGLFKGSTNLRVYVTTDNKVRIDPALLETGTSYRINIVAITGYYPNAANGDFAVRGYPASISNLNTGFFRVVKN